MRVAVYLRISLDRTGEELGVDRQRAECARVCKRHGWTDVVEYVDNDTSATRTRGPKTAYARMIADARSGSLGAVVVLDLDRLVRRPREIEDWIDLAVEGNVRLITADGEVDAATENGRMYLRIKAAVAMHEVERKGKRQRDQNQQAAERGLPPGGRRAFGYDGGKQVRREAAAVKEAYASLLAGDTLSGIAARLNKAGLTTTAGGLWKHNSVRTMLTNPRHAGLRAHRGTVLGKGAWRPIVGEDVYRAAVELLGDPGRRTNMRGNALSWLGTGLYLCGKGDHDQTVVCTYRGSKARGDQRRVYRCMTCYLTRSADPIDDYIERVTVARLRRSDLADLLATDTNASVDASDLRTEAAALRVRLNALADDLTISEALLARREKAIRQRLVEIEQQLAEAGRGSAVGSLLDAPDPGQAWLDQPDLGRRQAVVRDLMDVVILPAGPGRRVFAPDSVDIRWKG